MKRKPKAKNAWLLGYRAAMRASSIELTRAGLAAALEAARELYEIGDFGAEQFEAGWRSVLKCERAKEVSDHG